MKRINPPDPESLGKCPSTCPSYVSLLRVLRKTYSRYIWLVALVIVSPVTRFVSISRQLYDGHVGSRWPRVQSTAVHCVHRVCVLGEQDAAAARYHENCVRSLITGRERFRPTVITIVGLHAAISRRRRRRRTYKSSHVISIMCFSFARDRERFVGREYYSGLSRCARTKMAF